MKNLVIALALILAAACTAEPLSLVEPEHVPVEETHVARSGARIPTPPAEGVRVWIEAENQQCGMRPCHWWPNGDRQNGIVWENGLKHLACPIWPLYEGLAPPVVVGTDTLRYIKTRGGNGVANSPYGHDVLQKRVAVKTGQRSAELRKANTGGGPFTLAVTMPTIIDAVWFDTSHLNEAQRNDVYAYGAYPYVKSGYFSDAAVKAQIHDQTAVFHVYLDQPYTETITLESFSTSVSGFAAKTESTDWRTWKLDGSQDYVETVQDLVFSPGERHKTVRVPIINDCYPDGGEHFLFHVRRPQDENGMTTTTGNTSLDGDWPSDGVFARTTIMNHDTGPSMPTEYTFFQSIPDAHDGTSFTVDIVSTRPVRRRHLRGPQTTGGSVTHLRRHVGGERGLFRATVRPDGAGDVTVTHHGRNISVTIPYREAS